MVIISFKKTFEIDSKNFLLNTDSLIIQKNSEKKVKSQFAKDYTHILENDYKVISYCEQPFKINYFFQNSVKKFIPDFYVKYDDQSECIIFFDLGLINISEIKEVENILKKNAIHYQRLTLESVESTSNLVFNYKFLSNYHNKGKYISDLDIQLIFKIVDKFKKITVKNLLDEIGITFERRAELLFIVWYLINSKLLNFNKEEKLSINTIIWE